MAFDLTVADKGRTEALVADGKWRALTIAGKGRHQLAPGDRFLEVHLLGRVVDGGTATLWLRFQRYPQLDSTGWQDRALRARSSTRRLWGWVHGIHLTTKAGETYGVDYMIEAGSPAVTLRNRVLKGGQTT